jgi:hypothetical protein
MSTSPWLSRAKALASAFRPSALAPLIFSLKTLIAPASISRASCAANV